MSHPARRGWPGSLWSRTSGGVDNLRLSTLPSATQPSAEYPASVASGHGVPSVARDERGPEVERRHGTVGRAERSGEQVLGQDPRDGSI